MASFQLLEQGPLHAISTIDAFATANPQHAYMRIVQLNLLCKAAPGSNHSELVEQMHRDLPEAEFSHTSAVMLFELFGTVSSAKCNGVDVETAVSLVTILRDNPRYKEEALYNQAYQKILAALARQRGDYDAVVEHLREAIAYWPARDLNHMMVEALLHKEKFAAALQFIDEAGSLAPAHPVKAVMWRQDLEELRVYVRGLEQKAGTQDRELSAQGFDTHE
jgi:tetratricopeptide (TPR) repeat protein